MPILESVTSGPVGLVGLTSVSYTHLDVYKRQVLMRENDQIVGTSIDGVIIGNRRGRKALLHKNLVRMRAVKARRRQKIALEDVLIINSDNKCN